MSETDLRLRKDAVPYISWFVSHTNNNTNLALYSCPVLTAGNIVEAYLTLFLPVDSALSVRVMIGEFEDSDVEPVDTYTETYIKQSHARITGEEATIDSSAGFLILDGLNLLLERAKFNEHGFVLGLQFDRSLNSEEARLLADRLMINCSSIVGLK